MCNIYSLSRTGNVLHLKSRLFMIQRVHNLEKKIGVSLSPAHYFCVYPKSCKTRLQLFRNITAILDMLHRCLVFPPRFVTLDGWDKDCPESFWSTEEQIKYYVINTSFSIYAFWRVQPVQTAAEIRQDTVQKREISYRSWKVRS